MPDWSLKVPSVWISVRSAMRGRVPEPVRSRNGV
jgi:hypothetical protein